MHRFFQGYLYPSYTGSPVVKFKSPEAEAMWTSFRDFWTTSVTPASTGYAFMQEPLLTGEVWVAWDHVARLKDALNQKPDEFVVVPGAGRPGQARPYAGADRHRHPQDQQFAGGCPRRWWRIWRSPRTRSR